MIKKTLHDIYVSMSDCVPLTPDYPHGMTVLTPCCDSRKAGVASIFFCLVGKQVDGHDFALSAYHRGARAFVVEHEINLPDDAYVFCVPDARVALAEASAAFYDHPEQKMRLIGLTGTKGKTTTAFVIQSLLCAAGVPTGYIGTNGVQYGSYYFETVNSTPESLEIYRFLRDMVDAGYHTAVLEVSSQALWMDRVYGLDFDVCLFTNLSPDHIGGIEHPDFAHYKASKRRLFTEHHPRYIIYNADDPSNSDVISGVDATLIGISTAGAADAAWLSPRDEIAAATYHGQIGTRFFCYRDGDVIGSTQFVPLPGEMNVQNALMALAVVCDCFGVDPSGALRSLRTVKVTGRFETMTFPELPRVTFVIDYAHNGVSLASILDALRAYKPRRLICLFGSVGDRTFGRRTELAEAAGSRADLCILTSDNPGREDPRQIIAMIHDAFPEGSCPRKCIVDRAEAIEYAVSIAEKGDIILMAGKGHEAYQLIGINRLPYSEQNTLREAVKKRFSSEKNE